MGAILVELGCLDLSVLYSHAFLFTHRDVIMENNSTFFFIKFCIVGDLIFSRMTSSPVRLFSGYQI